MSIWQAASKVSEWGLVINWRFHCRNRWVSALTPFLVRAIVEAFDPILITSQIGYELCKRRVKYILSMEPGWAAPRIRYDRRQPHVVGVFVSDPHNKTDWFGQYVERNGIDLVFSYYKRPFLRHFPDFPLEKFVHFPWAVPDRLVSDHELSVRATEVAIFGARASAAYDVRNWCRDQPGVTNYEFSGVENKKLSDEEFFAWMRRFDAIVAAGSSNPIYDLVTPKYFEIPAAGALLVGQHCGDLGDLGFDETNSLLFTQATFLEQLARFRRDPAAMLPVREAGRELVLRRHTVGHRIKLIRSTLGAAQRRRAA